MNQKKSRIAVFQLEFREDLRFWVANHPKTALRAFDIIEKRTKEQPVEVSEKAVSNVKPVIEVKSRRVGGSTYQVPTEVVPERRLALAIRWLILHAKERAEKTMKEKLAAELIDAANNRGASVKKRESIHKMAEANKAFAHYRF